MMTRNIKDDWWNNNFFDAGMSKILFGAGKEKLSIDEAKWIIKITGITPPAKILDVGCGIGRHSVVFAKFGFDVLGIDISKEYLRKAAQLARQEKVNLTLKNMPMHTLSFKEEFDLVVNLFTSFGYYSPRSRNTTIFKKMVRALKYSGIMVFDTTYREFIENNFKSKDWRIVDRNTFVLEESFYSCKEKQIYVDRIYIHKGNVKHYRFKLHLFSAKELKELFRNNGLKIIGCYSSLSGMPFKKDSPHIVIVAKKSDKHT